jgi:hypothetical protein
MTFMTIVMHRDEHPHTTRHTERPSREQETASELLHVCEDCSGRLVYPLDWIDEAPHGWWMILRCPDCEAVREGMFAQPAVDLFADELDRGETVLLLNLKQAERENMAEAVDFFIRALHADLILPSDF